MNRLLALTTIVFVTGACEHRDRNGGAEATRLAPAPAPVDTRDQHQLLAELAAAEKMDEYDADTAFSDLRRSWLSKRYRWRVTFVPAFCQSAERCNAHAFDAPVAGKRKVQGWLPRIAVTESQRTELVRACAGVPTCQFTFEGTLAELNASTVTPTSLAFADVSLSGIGGDAI